MSAMKLYISLLSMKCNTLLCAESKVTFVPVYWYQFDHCGPVQLTVESRPTGSGCRNTKYSLSIKPVLK